MPPSALAPNPSASTGPKVALPPKWAATSSEQLQQCWVLMKLACISRDQPFMLWQQQCLPQQDTLCHPKGWCWHCSHWGQHTESSSGESQGAPQPACTEGQITAGKQQLYTVQVQDSWTPGTTSHHSHRAVCWRPKVLSLDGRKLCSIMSSAYSHVILMLENHSLTEASSILTSGSEQWARQWLATLSEIKMSSNPELLARLLRMQQRRLWCCFVLLQSLFWPY